MLRPIARIIVVSAAYLGDVAPFVEPANRLVERGHDVTYVVPAGYHEQLAGERFTLGTYPLDMSSRAMHADPEHERLLRHPNLNTVRLGRYWMRKAFVDDPEAVRAELVRALTGADAVVTHPTMASLAGPIARKNGVPLVVGHLFPMMVPGAKWSFPVGAKGTRIPPFGPRLNRALWGLYGLVAGPMLYDRAVNAFRRSFGEPPLRGNPFNAWMYADRTVLLVSRHYYPVDVPDWPDVTWGGFSHWAGPPGHEKLDPDVDAFLDAGDPPVLVTLGTSAATGAGPRFAAIARGLDDLGLRSLLLVGNGENMTSLAGRKGAFVFAPLAPVLARCRSAVISGSLGTIGAALAAGLPVVVVPQLYDQVWHGQQAERLGAGVLVKRTEDVPAAVARVEADRSYAERARELATALAAEDGAAALADAVESVLSSSRR
jgi:rhamnosyltransferase subunit B